MAAKDGGAVELQLRGTAPADDLDRAPQDLGRVSRSQSLHRGFLCREASREVNSGAAAAKAIGDFAFGENALDEAFAVSLDRLLDTRDVGGVEAETNDGGQR
jgi:hypothetical protein